MVRVYHRQLGKTVAGTPWIGEIDDAERGPYRDHGRRITSSLLGFIDAEDPEVRSAALAAGCAAAAEYGRIAAFRGIGMAETVEVFLRFRLPLLHELASVAQHRGLETGEAVDVLVEASEAIDRLLSALMEGHEMAHATAPLTSAARREAAPSPVVRGEAAPSPAEAVAQSPSPSGADEEASPLPAGTAAE